MSMKTTQREIRALAAEHLAQDITTISWDALQEIRRREDGFDRIAVSCGTYGINGGVYQGRNSGKLYAITCRASNLFAL